VRGESDAYQTVPRAVAVMPKSYDGGVSTGWHSHPRAQLLYATSGLTLVTAEDGTWILPARHALWIPPGLFHEVRMHGQVTMCSAYVTPEAVGVLPTGCRVLEVTPLLAAALPALAAEPMLYEEDGRGGHLAALVLDEIARAPETSLTLPLPRDPRLRRVCEALLQNPGSPVDLDGWAQRGNRGWGYADVLPYFKRMERRIGPGDATYRGQDGPLAVTDIDWRRPTATPSSKA